MLFCCRNARTCRARVLAKSYWNLRFCYLANLGRGVGGGKSKLSGSVPQCAIKRQTCSKEAIDHERYQSGPLHPGSQHRSVS